MLLILRVVLWVTHHIFLPFPLDYDLLLVAWNCVRSIEMVEKAEKMWRVLRGEPFTLLGLWRRVRFDACVLACPVRLTTTRANLCPTLSQ